MFKSTVCATALLFGLILANGLATYASEEMTTVMDEQPVITAAEDNSLSTIKDKEEEPSDPTPDQPSKPEE